MDDLYTMWPLYVLDTGFGLVYLGLAFLVTYVNCHFWSVVGSVRGRASRRNYRRQCKDCVIIFSRYPRAGTTKTRLMSTLGGDGAAYCQRLMVTYFDYAFHQRYKFISPISAINILFNYNYRYIYMHYIRKYRITFMYC